MAKKLGCPGWERKGVSQPSLGKAAHTMHD
jgi:hypothetical protein